MRQPGGIRKKITFWFYLVLIFMIGISAATYGIVIAVEEKLFNIEKVDTFLEDVLEVRRMEKNFLLYRDQDSIGHWQSYLDATEKQLAANKELFISLSSQHEIHQVQHALEAYIATFSKFQQTEHDLGPLAATIREHGNQLTNLAEELIIREHQTIHGLLALIKNSLLFMLPLLVFIFGAIAALLGKGIVSSLKQLGQHAETIASGNFVEVPFSSTNQEINNLVNAFNQMSRELKNRQQQLVRSEKLASLGTMLAGVAHEFNNPLSNISSSAQILAEELDDPKEQFAKELVDQISTETSRAAAIVNTLLSLARDETFHRDHHALKPLLQEILDLLRGQIAQDISIQLTVSDEVQVFADKQKIQQVFINLLKNSFDAMQGKGCIRIRAWQNEANLKITFTDDGPGIPKQIRTKVFDPFFTTKDTGEGSGLGLFIIHDIIVQHGGSINIDSNNHKGSRFTILLPTKERS